MWDRCVFRKVLADVGWEPVRGEGSRPDFCFTRWMTRQMAAIPFSTLICVDTVLSLDSQRPESILTEHCWDSLLALRSDQRCERLCPIKAFVKVIPKKPSSPCCGSLPNSLREHLKFNMRESELSSYLFPQRKKEKHTMEYLHNWLYLQFLGREEKEKDTGNIWDKPSGIQWKTRTGREGINARSEGTHGHKKI